jgi:hypothetical protein
MLHSPAVLHLNIHYFMHIYCDILYSMMLKNEASIWVSSAWSTFLDGSTISSDSLMNKGVVSQHVVVCSLSMKTVSW